MRTSTFSPRLSDIFKWYEWWGKIHYFDHKVRNGSGKIGSAGHSLSLNVPFMQLQSVLWYLQSFSHSKEQVCRTASNPMAQTPKSCILRLHCSRSRLLGYQTCSGKGEIWILDLLPLEFQCKKERKHNNMDRLKSMFGYLLHLPKFGTCQLPLCFDR